MPLEIRFGTKDLKLARVDVQGNLLVINLYMDKSSPAIMETKYPTGKIKFTKVQVPLLTVLPAVVNDTLRLIQSSIPHSVLEANLVKYLVANTRARLTALASGR